MRLITLSLVLLSVVQWFPFVHTASEIDNLQVYYEGAVQKWRKRVCSICLQLFDDRQADVDIDDAAKDQLLSNIVSTACPKSYLRCPDAGMLWNNQERGRAKQIGSPTCT